MSDVVTRLASRASAPALARACSRRSLRRVDSAALRPAGSAQRSRSACPAPEPPRCCLFAALRSAPAARLRASSPAALPAGHRRRVATSALAASAASAAFVNVTFVAGTAYTVLLFGLMLLPPAPWRRRAVASLWTYAPLGALYLALLVRRRRRRHSSRAADMCHAAAAGAELGGGHAGAHAARQPGGGAANAPGTVCDNCSASVGV